MKTSLNKKKGAVSRWLNSLTKDKAPENTFTKPEVIEPVDNTDIEKLRAELEAKDEIIRDLQGRLDAGGDVAITLAALGFEPSSLPEQECMDERMNREELWDSYSKLPVEERNAFYSKYRNEMATWNT